MNLTTMSLNKIDLATIDRSDNESDRNDMFNNRSRDNRSDNESHNTESQENRSENANNVEEQNLFTPPEVRRFLVFL